MCISVWGPYRFRHPDSTSLRFFFCLSSSLRIPFFNIKFCMVNKVELSTSILSSTLALLLLWGFLDLDLKQVSDLDLDLLLSHDLDWYLCLLFLCFLHDHLDPLSGLSIILAGSKSGANSSCWLLSSGCAVPFRFISGVRASSRGTGEIPPVKRLFQVESRS